MSAYRDAYCDHGVYFPVSKITLPAMMIRKLFPRLTGQCPNGCGFNGIAYASFEHFLAGDW